MTDCAANPAAKAADDRPGAEAARVVHDHAPDFAGDYDGGWIICTCEATFTSGVNVIDWWEHFKAQMLGLCIVCGSSDPDGPTDSNNDKWCNACNDAAVSG